MFDQRFAWLRVAGWLWLTSGVRREHEHMCRNGEGMNTPLRLIVAVFVSAALNLSASTLYVAERYSGRVLAVDTVTGEARIVASGLGEMIGIAVDRKDRLFVSHFSLFSDGSVVQVDTQTGSSSTICRVAGVFALSADPNADTLYLGAYNSKVLHRVLETQPDQWTIDTAATFATSAVYVHAFRDGDRLYVTCENDGLWVKDLASGDLRLMLTIPTAATIMAKESGGHLIVGSESMEKVVYRIDPLAGQVVQTYTNFSGPVGLAVDPSDNALYVAETDANKITRLDLQSGERTTVTTAVDTPWQIAFAMPFRIKKVIRSQDAIIIGWTGGPGIRLQKMVTLTNPDWQDVEGTDGADGVVLPTSDGGAFFRLVRSQVL
jgi:DNA-binding beta-propeller fold protein YncE